MGNGSPNIASGYKGPNSLETLEEHIYWLEMNIADVDLILKEAKKDGLTRSEYLLIEHASWSGSLTPTTRSAIKAFVNNYRNKYEMEGRPISPTQFLSDPELRGGILKDPAVMKKHQGQARYEVHHIPFRTLSHPYSIGNSVSKIEQGQAGDCYFLAVLSIIGRDKSHLLEDKILIDGDGSVWFKFYNFLPDRQEEWVRVDADIPMINGQPVYANSEPHLLISLYEKAYAKWKGGYEYIGNGGFPKDVFGELLGKGAERRLIKASDTSTLANSIAGGCDEYPNLFDWMDCRKRHGGLMVMASHSDENLKATGMYREGELFGPHAYTITKIDTTNKTVSLHNPWGNGPTHGVITVTFDQFLRVAQYVDYWNPLANYIRPSPSK